MRNLSAVELLVVWENTLGKSPVQQALVLLNAACPEHSQEQLAKFSIGQRDWLLLGFRERLFGPTLNSVAACPQCKQRVELTFDVGDIRIEDSSFHSLESVGKKLSVTRAGYQVDFRLPNSLDLEWMETCGEVHQAEEQLLYRCIHFVMPVGEGRNEQPISEDIGPMPPALIEAIIERMTQEDPQANTQLHLNCPDCKYEWHAAFDILNYLIAEIHNWAKRILREVHGLAGTYGWREADILAMSPTRRYAYLELAGLGV